MCAWACGGDLHRKRSSASTPTHFTRGPAGRAPHAATELAPSPDFPGRGRRPKPTADTLDGRPQPPPKPQLPGNPYCAPSECRERTRRPPTMLFYDRKRPLPAGVGGRRTVPRPPRSLLPPCGRREKCTAGGCGADFLERGRSPGPFAFVGPVLPCTPLRTANRMIRRFCRVCVQLSPLPGPEHLVSDEQRA